MHFRWASINVKNIAESVRFYQKIIGLDVMRKINPNPEMEIVFLGSGETQIELIWNAKNKETNYGKDISLGFEVESVDKMMELLKEKNISILSGPFQPNPAIKFIYIQDPDGLKIQFVENIK
jgi:lactoylglutathione lyase